MSYLYVKWNRFMCSSLASGSVIRASFGFADRALRECCPKGILAITATCPVCTTSELLRLHSVVARQVLVESEFRQLFSRVVDGHCAVQMSRT